MPTTSTSNDDAPPSSAAESPAPVKSDRRKMSMALVNFWLDAALLVTVVFIMWVTVMMQVVFPAPTRAAGWRLWGFTYNEWHNAQFYALCVCALLAIEHVVLHWNWICSVLATQVLRVKKRPDEGVQAAYGIGFFISLMVMILGSLVAAVLTVHKPHP